MTEPSAVPAPPPPGGHLLMRSEARLVRLAASGDERAFAAIYRRYHQEIYRYCRAIVGNAEDAEDALQNTMASALRSLPGEERQIKLRPWLYRVARNESISLLRGRRPRAEANEQSLPFEPPADVAFESRERLRALVADLAALPERQRSALVMRELSGLSNEQIAMALEVSPGAARQVVYEARVALQELEEGRAMECDEARLAISERDGRVLRGRKLRAHLRACARCRDFRAGIEARRVDLRMVAPPLPAAAAAGVFASVLGGASVKGGVLGGIISGGATTVMKGAGIVTATVAIGAGAGGLAGVELPLTGDKDDVPATESAPASSSGGPTPATAPSASGGPEADGTATKRAGKGEGSGRSTRIQGKRPGRGKAKGKGKGNGQPAASSAPAAAGSAAGGASAVAPAGAGRPETPPGSSVAEPRSGGRAASPVTGPPSHSSAGEGRGRGRSMK